MPLPDAFNAAASGCFPSGADLRAEARAARAAAHEARRARIEAAVEAIAGLAMEHVAPAEGTDLIADDLDLAESRARFLEGLAAELAARVRDDGLPSFLREAA